MLPTSCVYFFLVNACPVTEFAPSTEQLYQMYVNINCQKRYGFHSDIKLIKRELRVQLRVWLLLVFINYIRIFETLVIGLKDELKRKLSHLKEEQDELNLQNCDKMNKLETDLQKIKNQLSKVVNESSGTVTLSIYACMYLIVVGQTF